MDTAQRMAATAASVLIALFASAAWGARPAQDATAAEPVPADGALVVHVALVASDLSVKPVPKQRFAIVTDAGDPVTEVATSFGGQIDVRLPAGTYRIRSDAPVELVDRAFSWDVAFEIRAGGETVLELSNDNASVDAVDEPVSDEGEIYRNYSSGVFKVLGEGGHGSGFLISEDGLVLTNHHVVHESDYLAVKCDDRHKHQAVLVAGDSQADLAVLRVHSETVRDRAVLQLAEDGPDAPPVAVGDRVLAIGSPLTTDTILTSGIVSKVERESIYSDVNINEGNSGGPLFNSRGLVVGVNTFGIGGGQGPGVSGVVRIYRALPVIEEARRVTGESEPPSPRLLPVAAEYRFSPDEVKDQALTEEREFKDYHVEAGKIDVQFFTPTLMASAIIRNEREAAKGRDKRRKRKKGKAEQPEEEPYEPGEQFYDWQKQSENFKPVVRIRAFPEVKMKFGSALGAALIGSGTKYRFKTDFARMELRRDGEPVEPIHPGRIKQVVHVEGAATMKDIGYWGLYEYPPEAFAGGGSVTLLVWEDGVPEPFRTILDPELMAGIREDFAPYFAWLEDEGSGAVEP
jgi:S1-C subfamily serine protease